MGAEEPYRRSSARLSRVVIVATDKLRARDAVENGFGGFADNDRNVL